MPFNTNCIDFILNNVSMSSCIILIVTFIGLNDVSKLLLQHVCNYVVEKKT